MPLRVDEGVDAWILDGTVLPAVEKQI